MADRACANRPATHRSPARARRVNPKIAVASNVTGWRTTIDYRENHVRSRNGQLARGRAGAGPPRPSAFDGQLSMASAVAATAEAAWRVPARRDRERVRTSARRCSTTVRPAQERLTPGRPGYRAPGGQPSIFRAGVVIVVRHPDRGAVLAFERADVAGTAGSCRRAGCTTARSRSRRRGASWRRRPGSATPTSSPAPSTRSGSPTSGPTAAKAAAGATGKRLGQVQRWFLFDALDAEIEPDAGRQRVRRLAVGRRRRGSIDHVRRVASRPAYARVLGDAVTRP